MKRRERNDREMTDFDYKGQIKEPKSVLQASDKPPEYWAITCPMTGKAHYVRFARIVFFPEGVLIRQRICQDCGLFDTFIEESP